MSKFFSETQYYQEITRKNGEIQLRNDNGEDLLVPTEYATQCLVSADDFNSQKSVTRTEAASIFIGNPGVVMSVNFNKKVDEKDVVSEIMGAINSSTIGNIEKAVKEAIKKGLTGEPRTMIGRHWGELNEFGRVPFIDMEATKDTTKNFDSRQRQVDPRTLNWLIIKGIKYNVK